MNILVDTSILVRLANRADNLHGSTTDAILLLHRTGHSLHLASQSLIEFRSVATRPILAANGLGMSSADAIAHATVFETAFPVLPDTADTFVAWKQIVEIYSVMGKQVHDARLVAACAVHSMDAILTFNARHFERLASFVRGLRVVTPGATISPP